MTFLDKLKNLFKGKAMPAISFNTGMTPMYSQYGQDVFQDEVVMQAVGQIVSEIMKLKPKHVKRNNTDLVPQERTTIQNVLDNPNPLMIQSDFIEKVMWNYFFNSNSFIIPKYYFWKDKYGNLKKYFTELYPVRPTQVNFLQDAKNEYYVEFHFPNLQPVTFPYKDIIHLRREFSHDDFMGGNSFGQPNNTNLRETLKLNEQLLDSVAKNLNASCKINGILKVKSYLDDAKLKKAIEDFNKLLESNQSGILPMDSTSDYVDLKKDIKLVDPETLKFIDEKILRNFGVPLSILKGEYTKEQYEAFYQKALEPIILKLGQAFTKTLFTDRERSFGNEIIFYTEDLLFLTISQKLELTRLLGDSGALYENEKRRMFGLAPLKELEGVRTQSLNYVNVDVAQLYQIGLAGKEKDKKNDNKKENKSIEELRGKYMDIENKEIKRDNENETRAFEFEVRAKKNEEHGTYIEGKPIVYGDKYDCGGMFEETIDKGALDNTDLKDVRFLVNHDLNKIPLARSRNNNKNSTMQLEVVVDGMNIRANLDVENNAEAKALYSAVERGDITGMSFMFRTNGEKWENLDSDYPTRHITSISKVYEVSAVTFPAYENTSIKARSKSVLDNARAKSLDSDKQALDSAKTELLLEKEKFRALFG